MNEWKPLTTKQIDALTAEEWVQWGTSVRRTARAMGIRGALLRDLHRNIIIAKAIQGTIESCDKFMSNSVL